MGRGIQNIGWQQPESSTNPMSHNQVGSPLTHLLPHFCLSQNCLPCKPSFRVSFMGLYPSLEVSHHNPPSPGVPGAMDNLGMTFGHDLKAMVKAHRCCIRLPHLSSGGPGVPMKQEHVSVSPSGCLLGTRWTTILLISE